MLTFQGTLVDSLQDRGHPEETKTEVEVPSVCNGGNAHIFAILLHVGLVAWNPQRVQVQASESREHCGIAVKVVCHTAVSCVSKRISQCGELPVKYSQNLTRILLVIYQVVNSEVSMNYACALLCGDIGWEPGDHLENNGGQKYL